MNSKKTFLERVWAFASLAVLPEDDEQAVWRKHLLTIASLFAPMSLVLVGIIYLIFDEPFAGLAYLGFVVYIWINLYLFVTRHRNYHIILWALMLPPLPLHFLVALSLGNFINSGAIVMWGLAFPGATALVFLPMRRTIPFFLAFVFNVVVTTFLQPSLRDSTHLPEFVVMLIFATNITALSLFIIAIFAYFIRQRDLAFQLLRGEQVKAENLLLNILPPEIVSILKNDSRTIAEHFDGASILFADVVNFTPMSATMTPVQLVELLNEIFTHFDSIIEKYGLEKIKTIGDCYMVASGVPRPRADHAQALVRMALEMQNYVAGNEFQGKKLNFRIGINSGPVVAGVIGRKKFIYDLWGDAVNTASRMESHGTGGTVQITESTYDLIKDDFVCESRGIVNIKGKGEMSVWHVIRENHGSPSL